MGGRTIKTVIAVFLCFLVDTVRNSNTAFYAAIAAILCIQRTPKDSLREALNREIATIIGGVWGMTVLLIEKNIYLIPCEILRYLCLPILLIPPLYIAIWNISQKAITNPAYIAYFIHKLASFWPVPIFLAHVLAHEGHKKRAGAYNPRPLLALTTSRSGPAAPSPSKSAPAWCPRSP